MKAPRELHNSLVEIATAKKQERFKVQSRLVDLLDTLEVDAVEEPTKTPSESTTEPQKATKITRQRSVPQNSALHKDCAIIADKLNKIGATMDKVLKDGFTLQWTERNIAAMFGVKAEGIEPMLTLVATCLNEAGYEPIAYIKNSDNSTWWTTMKVKEFLWRPVQESLYKKVSTTELEKTSGEIKRIHEILMRELGEKHGVEWHDFPHDKEKAWANLAQQPVEKVKTKPDKAPEYPDPEDFKKPTI